MVFLKIVNYSTPYKNNKKKTNVKYFNKKINFVKNNIFLISYYDK